MAMDVDIDHIPDTAKTFVKVFKEDEQNSSGTASELALPASACIPQTPVIVDFEMFEEEDGKNSSGTTSTLTPSASAYRGDPTSNPCAPSTIRTTPTSSTSSKADQLVAPVRRQSAKSGPVTTPEPSGRDTKVVHNAMSSMTVISASVSKMEKMEKSTEQTSQTVTVNSAEIKGEPMVEAMNMLKDNRKPPIRQASEFRTRPICANTEIDNYLTVVERERDALGARVRELEAERARFLSENGGPCMSEKRRGKQREIIQEDEKTGRAEELFPAVSANAKVGVAGEQETVLDSILGSHNKLMEENKMLKAELLKLRSTTQEYECQKCQGGQQSALYDKGNVKMAGVDAIQS